MGSGNRGPILMGLTWTLTAIVLVLVAARFYVRTSSKTLGADDWLMLVATLFRIGDQVLLTIANSFGLGKKTGLSINQIVEILKYCFIAIIPGTFASVIARISIVIFLWRIFGSKRWLKAFLIINTVAQTALAIAFVVYTFCEVKPIQGVWDPRVKSRRLNPKVGQDLGYATQALFTFSDMTYVLFPVIIIWKLNMPLRQKIGLCLLLGLGIVTMVASILKTTVVGSVQNLSDAQYKNSLSKLWSAIEQCFVIIMGCIPTLRPLTKHAHELSRRSLSSLRNLLTRSAVSRSRRTTEDLSNVDSNSLPVAQFNSANGSGRLSNTTTVRSSDDNMLPKEGRIHKSTEFGVSSVDRLSGDDERGRMSGRVTGDWMKGDL